MKETQEKMEVAVSVPVVPDNVSIWANSVAFTHAQRVAGALASSDLVPQQFKNNIANTLIALDMANRLEANPLAVMQSIYIVHGKPSWAATFVIAMVNACGKYAPLKFEITGAGDERTCIAWTTDKSGERLESPGVSIGMAKAEGWYAKNGSKWKTMPELMLRYRAATFFGRLYAPELLMGMRTMEEVEDLGESPQEPWTPPVEPRKLAGIPAELVKSEPEPEPEEDDVPYDEPEPQPKAEKPKKTKPASGKQFTMVDEDEHATPQMILAKIVIDAGFCFDDFAAWAEEGGYVEDASSMPSFAELPDAEAERFIKSKVGLIRGLTALKVGEVA